MTAEISEIIMTERNFQFPSDFPVFLLVFKEVLASILQFQFPSGFPVFRLVIGEGQKLQENVSLRSLRSSLRLVFGIGNHI